LFLSSIRLFPPCQFPYLRPFLDELLGLAKRVLGLPTVVALKYSSAMFDEDDDLSADSGGDTDDLIAESKAKPIAKKKTLKKNGAAAKKRKLEKSIPGT
jgi:hypothetical protein